MFVPVCVVLIAKSSITLICSLKHALQEVRNIINYVCVQTQDNLQANGPSKICDIITTIKLVTKDLLLWSHLVHIELDYFDWCGSDRPAHPHLILYIISYV